MAAVPVAQLQPPHQATPLLDAEKLDVFRVAVEFQVVASQLASGAPAALRDQFERASVSIVLNIGEGAASQPKR